MSRFQKSNLTVNGDSIHLSMPISKVDKEKRTVSGYATLDNVDSQGDVVTAEASAKAFARARGNIREMHENKAVGKLVKFAENEFFDNESGDLYRGVYVTAYVSKGAPDTWEKVLDGTLTGFSIGGEINEASNEFVKDANHGKGANIRFIKDYDLVELSLVDNPANQLANVLSIQKSATGSVTATGIAADVEVQTVFICSSDGTVQVTDEESATCPVCETKMEDAGWFESGADRVTKVKEIVKKFLTADTEDAPESVTEGGVEMTIKKNNDEVVEGKPVDVVNPSETFPDGEKVDENAKTEEEKAADVEETEGTEEEAEESAAPEEVEDEDTVIEKKIGELHSVIQSSLDKSRNDSAEQIATLEKKIESFQSEVLEKTSELEEKFTKFSEELKTTKAHTARLEKALDALNSSDAFRKSGEVEDDEPVVKTKQESVWKGAFSGKRFSLDDHM